jgi:hypothetical protein
MRLDRKSILKCILFLIAVQALAVLAAVPSFAQTSTPAVVSSSGYINGTALTTHTTAAFNSSGATTLVAFVSSHSQWNGLPVSINNLNDNVGNTWTELTGPTVWVGQSFPLLSAIYYVNAPVSSAAHMLTVSLSNPAPLVVHVFAVSGSDVSGPPINSAITDPGAGVTSAVVMTAPISVPSDTLLLSWVKNETDASATAVDGYKLDPQSTSFLWAESQTALSAGSYTGDFQYSAAIGWQTAIVGLKPPGTTPPPVLTSTPADPANETSASFSFSDTELGVSFLCQLDQSAFSTCLSPTTYSGLTQGSHMFSVKAQGASGNQSAATSYSWTINIPSPTVSSVSPTSGSVPGGTAVTITGTNFAAGATVTFGGAAATNVVVVSGTQITAKTPAGSAGSVTVTVTVNGQSGSLASGFTYVTPPTVSGVSPSAGPIVGGTAVTITGTNFAAGATVTFGGAAATNVVVVSGTQITATTPAGSAGAVTVTVTNPGAAGGSLASAFTYVVVPTVSSVSPNSGTTAGGTAVTITGTNFTAGATVTFGATAATNVVVVSGTQITATTPAGSAGVVTVIVTVNGQSGSLASGFTYGAPAPDYSLSISSPSLTLVAGSSGSLGITVSPQNGFKQTLGLACSGLPSGATCNFNPQSVNPTVGSVSSTLTMQAPSSGKAGIPSHRPLRQVPPTVFYILAFALIGIAAAGLNQKESVRYALPVATSILFAVLLVTAGCASSGGTQNQDPTMTYVVTVTASAANAPTHSQQFTLNINP